MLNWRIGIGYLIIAGVAGCGGSSDSNPKGGEGGNESARATAGEGGEAGKSSQKEAGAGRDEVGEGGSEGGQAGSNQGQGGSGNSGSSEEGTGGTGIRAGQGGSRVVPVGSGGESTGTGNRGGGTAIPVAGTGSVTPVKGIGGTSSIRLPPVGGSTSVAGTSSVTPTGGTTNVVEVVELPPVELPESCEEEYRSQYSDGCDLQMYCGDKMYAYAQCWETSPGVAECNCFGENNSQQFTLEGVNAQDGCEYTMGVCLGEVAKPEFQEEPKCGFVYQETNSDWCMSELQCSQSADITEGATMTDMSYKSMNCDKYDDNWNCYCYDNGMMGVGMPPRGFEGDIGFVGGGGTNTTFTLPADTPSSSACPLARDVCSGGIEIEPVGSLACEPTYQTGSGDYCSAEVTCSREARAGDISLQLNQMVSIGCVAEDGAWSCGCSYDGDMKEFALTNDNAWDACTDASARCVEELVE